MIFILEDYIEVYKNERFFVVGLYFYLICVLYCFGVRFGFIYYLDLFFCCILIKMWNNEV